MPKNNNTQKIIVIGWDGGSFDVLDMMIKKDKMPNLKSLMERGVRAPFISTLPPLTSPAWTSFRTGRTPANHGLFGFFKPPQNSLDTQAIERHTSESIKDPAFWNVLNHHGKKVCIVDMPITDPVEEIDGVIVSGMMSRGKDGVQTHPARVGTELTEALPQFFGRTLTDGVDTSAKYLDELITSLEWKFQEDLFLMNNYEWDCFMTVFSAVDTLQHYFWKYIDKSCKDYKQDKKIFDRIEKFYEKLDQTLGRYVEKAGSDIPIMIASDHGFGPSDYVVYVNNFLEESGYLTKKASPKSYEKIFFNKTLLKKILKKVDIFHLRSRINIETRTKINAVMERAGLQVAWDDSRAYFRANSEEGIYINIKGKLENGCVDSSDYESCVESLIAKLSGLKNPKNGEDVFEFVKKRADVHDGVHQGDAPDIILRPARGYVLRCYKHGGLPIEKYDDPFLSGTHSREGIFIAAGCGIAKGKCLESVDIEDFAPTLLYASGTPLPSNLDGNISMEVFTDDFISAHPPVYEKDQNIQAKSFQNVQKSEQEDEVIKKQLSQLGYID